MLMIISPAKTLDFETPVTTESYSIPDYLENSAELVEIMKKKSLQDLVNMMQVSQKIAELNVERFKSWKLPFSPDNSRQALLAFKGDVYTGLDTATLSEEDFDYAQSHLRILSGLYGVLKPLDLIQPYRLEMGTKFENAKGKNLYDFWSNQVTSNLNKNIKKHENKTIINCSSNEYFNVIDQKNLEGNILNTVFKEYRDGELKFISFNAKKARGLLAKFVINNKITRNKDLKDFDLENYKFDSSLSDDSTFVFTR